MIVDLSAPRGIGPGWRSSAHFTFSCIRRSPAIDSCDRQPFLEIASCRKLKLYSASKHLGSVAVPSALASWSGHHLVPRTMHCQVRSGSSGSASQGSFQRCAGCVLRLYTGGGPRWRLVPSDMSQAQRNAKARGEKGSQGRHQTLQKLCRRQPAGLQPLASLPTDGSKVGSAESSNVRPCAYSTPRSQSINKAASEGPERPRPEAWRLQNSRLRQIHRSKARPEEKKLCTSSAAQQRSK